MSFSLDRADTQKYGLANGRLHNWRVGLTVFKNYPFFGTSMREYANIAKGYDSSWRTQSRTATLENDFISLLACTGVVGTLFFIAAASVVLFRIIRCLIKKIKRKQMHQLSNVWMPLTIVFIIGVTMLFTDAIVLTNTLQSALFWISLGVVLKQVEIINIER